MPHLGLRAAPGELSKTWSIEITTTYLMERKTLVLRIVLAHAWQRIFFVAAVFLLAGALIFLTGTAYLAEHWNASSRPELWLKAVSLEPDDAKYWAQVGLEKQWELNPGDMQSLRYLKKATQADPGSADLWMDLADGYQVAGDPVHAQEAYEKAQADYPISPEVAWRYGSFLLYEGDFVDGYAEIQRALKAEPSLTASAISECWQSNPSVGAILDNVLPTKSDYYVKAIDFFLSQNLPIAAMAVWDQQLARGLPVKMNDAIPLVDELIDQARFREAEQTWHAALRAANWPHDSTNGNDSLVFNGRFEHGIANGGFDWREIASNGAQFALDDQIAHSGLRSLRTQFDGTANLDFQNLSQYIAVQARTTYYFSAYMRTEGISTDSGIRFEIFDPRNTSQLAVVTPDIRGTNPWTLVQANVVTGPDTHLLEIVLRRLPSWKFDNKLSGTVWIDDVRLSPSGGREKDGPG